MFFNKSLLIMISFLVSLSAFAGLGKKKLDFMIFSTEASIRKATQEAIENRDWRTLVQLHDEAGSFDFGRVMRAVADVGVERIPEETMIEIIDTTNDGYSDKRRLILQNYLLKTSAPYRFRVMHHAINEYSVYVISIVLEDFFRSENFRERHDVRLRLMSKAFDSDVSALVVKYFERSEIMNDPRYFWMAAFRTDSELALRKLKQLLAEKGENPGTPWIELRQALMLPTWKKRQDYLLSLIEENKVTTGRTCSEVMKH